VRESVLSHARNNRPRPDISTEVIVALYADGVLQRRIAEQLGCDIAAVSKRLVTAGVIQRRPGGPLKRRRVPDPALDAEVARRYEAGESFRAIGAAFGHSDSWAWRSVERMGIERRVSSRRRRGRAD
jgi:hypothetical protein